MLKDPSQVDEATTGLHLDRGFSCVFSIFVFSMYVVFRWVLDLITWFQWWLCLYLPGSGSTVVAIRTSDLFIYLFICLLACLPACQTRPALSFETGFHIAQTAFGLLPRGAGIARMCTTATVMGSLVLPSQWLRPWYVSWTSAAFFNWCLIKWVEQRLCIQCFHLCAALDFTVAFPALLCCWSASPQRVPWFAFISPLSL